MKLGHTKQDLLRPHRTEKGRNEKEATYISIPRSPKIASTFLTFKDKVTSLTEATAFAWDLELRSAMHLEGEFWHLDKVRKQSPSI